MAAQMLGADSRAGLCRRGRRRDGLRAGARRSDASRRSRIRSRSTSSCRSPIACPSSAHIVYDEQRGLRDYDDAQSARARRRDRGRPRGARRSEASAPRSTREIAAGKGSRSRRSSSTPRAPPGRSKGVVLTGERSIAAARDTVAFDQSDRARRSARLSAARLGRRPLSELRAGLGRRLLHGLPGKRRHAWPRICARSGRRFYFAPPRVFEALLTRVMIRMEDAGCLKRRLFRLFHRRGASAAARASSTASRCRSAARLHLRARQMLVYGPLKNVLGFSRVRVAYTAGEAIGAELFAFYRSIGLNLKQLYGQTEAFLYVTAQPDGANPLRHGRAACAERRHPHRRRRRGAVQVARHVRRLFQGAAKTARGDDAGRLS